jgi:hypothetical protein
MSKNHLNASGLTGVVVSFIYRKNKHKYKT